MNIAAINQQATNCPVGHLCIGDGCSIRSMCLNLAGQRAKEAAEAASKDLAQAQDRQHPHPHPHHHPPIARPFEAARNTGVIRIDCFMNELGEWKVVAPNNHHRVAAHIDHIADCIRLVVADYGDFCRALVTKGPDGGSDI